MFPTYLCHLSLAGVSQGTKCSRLNFTHTRLDSSSGVPSGVPSGVLAVSLSYLFGLLSDKSKSNSACESQGLILYWSVTALIDGMTYAASALLPLPVMSVNFYDTRIR